jgi:hypothetical protein
MTVASSAAKITPTKSFDLLEAAGVRCVVRRRPGEGLFLRIDALHELQGLSGATKLGARVVATNAYATRRRDARGAHGTAYLA